MFPLTAEDFSEDVFEILTELFASPGLTFSRFSPPGSPCAHSGFQDLRLTTLPTSSPTLPSDGESATLLSTVNEGHFLESGDLKAAFFSGDLIRCVVH